MNTQTKMKHTRGPWHMRTEGNGFRVYSESSSQAVNRWKAEHPEAKLYFESTYIAEPKQHWNGSGGAFGPHSIIDLDEVEANARLIASAPELLEACQELVADLLSHAQLGLNEKEVTMLKRAEAAIAKATGEGM